MPPAAPEKKLDARVRRSAPARARGRAPLQQRRRIARIEARTRIELATRVPIPAADRPVDPLAALVRPRRSPAARSLRWLGLALGSVAIHGAVVALGVIIGSVEFGRRDVVPQQVTITVREPPPPPPPEPPPPVEQAAPEPEAPPAPTPPPPKQPPPPKVAKAAPPPPQAAPPPAEAPKTPPPRVVGLSLESTSEGGAGPAFAVGNTREGETAKRAADPKNVAPVGVGPIVADPAPTAGNQVATRIPTGSVAYTQPKKTKEVKPEYPPQLKAQGLEGNVTLMVKLDEAGKVASVKIIKSSGFPELDEAARAAAMQEEYSPATRDGAPIPYTISFTSKFRLNEE